MSLIHILVRDSYHTDTIAENLRAYFGKKVVCHKDNVPEGVTIDLFFLSGMNILTGGSDYVSNFKRLGSLKSKVVAVSVDDGFLREIGRHPEFGVDFTFPKGKLMKLPFADKGIDNAESILAKILATVS